MGACCSGGIRHHKLQELVSSDSLTVTIITWNVNAKRPSATFSQLFNRSNIAFDMYVVALQEVVDLTAKNLIIDNQANLTWESEIDSILNRTKKTKHKYSKLHSIGLVGLLLMIYVKESLLPEITEVMSAKHKTGLFDMAGNKGGVGIRFQLYSTSLCFVNCHLAAHRPKVKERNEDYHKIMAKLQFLAAEDKEYEKSTSLSSPRILPPLSPKESSSQIHVDFDEQKSDLSNMSKQIVSNVSSSSNLQKRGALKKGSSVNALKILEHDIVFICGDLNYRLEFEHMNEVLPMIENQSYARLLQKEQLRWVRANAVAFGGFEEHAIEFRPTFKFEPGTNEYSNKRIPSYCDRILWRMNKSVVGEEKKEELDAVNEEDGEQVKRLKNVCCFKYRCCDSEIMSDHKPVYGLFRIEY